MYASFRKNYELLRLVGVQSTSADVQLSRIHSSSSCISDFRQNVLQVAHSELPIPRDDYLEFVELCTVSPRGELEAHPVTFTRPGAIHKARWMAKLIYSIKICLNITYKSCLVVLSQQVSTGE